MLTIGMLAGARDGVTAEFIKQKRAEGKKGLTLEEYIALKYRVED